MDAIDRKILMLLQSNSKQNTKEIATKIGLTVSPTFERIKKLEEKKYIKNYVAILNPDKIEKAITVFCQISLKTHSKELLDSFKNEVSRLTEVMSCHHMSGNYDFLLKFVVKDINEYQTFSVEKLPKIKGISNVQSSFVIEEISNSTSYNLE
jgi:Lrp/AsnC family leucine-responsive transcriptional regulator